MQRQADTVSELAGTKDQLVSITGVDVRLLSGCEQIAGPTRFFAMSPKPTRAQFTFL